MDNIHFDFIVDESGAETIIDIIHNEAIECLANSMNPNIEKNYRKWYKNQHDYLLILIKKMKNTKIEKEKLKKYSVTVSATYIGTIDVLAKSPEDARDVAKKDIIELNKPIDLNFSNYNSYDLGEEIEENQ
jgi:hypothetical protein